MRLGGFFQGAAEGLNSGVNNAVKMMGVQQANEELGIKKEQLDIQKVDQAMRAHQAEMENRIKQFEIGDKERANEILPVAGLKEKLAANNPEMADAMERHGITNGLIKDGGIRRADSYKLMNDVMNNPQVLREVADTKIKNLEGQLSSAATPEAQKAIQDQITNIRLGNAQLKGIDEYRLKEKDTASNEKTADAAMIKAEADKAMVGVHGASVASMDNYRKDKMETNKEAKRQLTAQNMSKQITDIDRVLQSYSKGIDPFTDQTMTPEEKAAKQGDIANLRERSKGLQNILETEYGDLGYGKPTGNRVGGNAPSVNPAPQPSPTPTKKPTPTTPTNTASTELNNMKSKLKEINHDLNIAQSPNSGVDKDTINNITNQRDDIIAKIANAEKTAYGNVGTLSQTSTPGTVTNINQWANPNYRSLKDKYAIGGGSTPATRTQRPPISDFRTR